MAKGKSFTISFDEEATRAVSGIASFLKCDEATVIRKAINLLSYSVSEVRQGGELIIENKSKNLRKVIENF